MSKGQRTRAAILEEAVRLASEVGLEGLSINTLANQTGMSKSGLFAHFGSKEKLQLQTLESATDSFIREVAEPGLRQPSGKKRLWTFFRKWIEWSRDRGCPFVAAAAEFDDRSGLVREYIVTAQREWLDTIGAAAAKAKRLGEFRSDLDEEQFSNDMLGIYLAYHHANRLMDDPSAEKRATTAFENLVIRCSTTGTESIQ